MGSGIPVRDPRSGGIDFELVPALAEDVAREAARLRAGQAAWQDLGLEGRGAVLSDFAGQLAAAAGPIVAALERDTGRRAIAGLELKGVVGSLRGWVAQAPGLLPEGWSEGRMDGRMRHAPQWVPFGLVGVISPWNFPLTLSMIDTIPALLAGCAVLLKPSEVTPRFARPLMEVVAAVPALASVFGLVQGGGATGAALVDQVDAVCFTGSVVTGRKVAVQAAGRLIPAFLELGGKDPLIITATADLDRAVTAALRGSVLSTGQACQSIERIYVARPLHDAFVARLAQAAKATRLNHPDITAGEIGPIIFDRQADILRAHLADAAARGAVVEAGGTVEELGGGLWLRPTVLSGVTHEMAVMREETFGPILPVMAFDTVEEAIALANDSPYGLSAAVIAGTLDEAEAIGRQIEAGAISLNDAALTSLFHEAEKHSFKASGLGGSRMGAAGFQRFCRRKALIANRGAPTPLSAFAEDAGG
jgi:acyl-CoA reductase-like NAD-dependent aldehyde dehydrogenase